MFTAIYVVMAMWFGISAGVVGQRIADEHRENKSTGTVYKVGVDYSGKTVCIEEEAPARLQKEEPPVWRQ